jgi:hypothetical protein
MHAKSIKVAVLLLAAALPLGCNVGKNDSASTTPIPNASLVGLWSGTDSTSGLGVVAIVDAAGSATILRSDDAQFVGNLTTAGDAIAAAVDGYANYGHSFSDRANFGIGTLDGSVVPGASITANLAFTTNLGTALPGTWSLSYGTLTGIGSSLAAVARNYTDDVTGATVSITGSGVITSQNPTTGCVLNGSIATSDATIDVYQVDYTLANCTGAYAPLNGVAFSGLGYLDNTNLSVKLVYAVAGSSAAGNFGIASRLTGA